MTTRVPTTMLGVPSSANLQVLIDSVSIAGGGTVYLGGTDLTLGAGVIVKDDVTLDLGGATLTFNLSGANDCGVRLRNRAHVRNGTINVVSGGSPGSQAGIHAPVLVGALYGESPGVGNISPDEGVTGWSATNLKLSTNAVGKVGIQVMGAANNGLIENIEIPDSATMGGCVHLDWGLVGGISSGDIPGSRAAFDAGTGYTTHPHNIVVRNIKGGALTRAKGGEDVGSFGVRLSGVYNVRVENVRIKSVTYGAIKITAGDLGFEFAKAEVKPLRCKGIVVDGVAVENTNTGWLVSVDSYADNVAREGGYTPLIDVLHETDMLVRHCTGKGTPGASSVAGLDIRQIRGGRFLDIDASGYAHGCLIDERVFGVEVHGRFWGNRGHGILVDHGTYPPEDVAILPGTHCYQNGQDGGFSNPSGVWLQNCIRARVKGVLLGHRTAASETTQARGLTLSNVTLPTDVSVEDCHVFSVKSGGIAYVLMNSDSYNRVNLFVNNTADAAISTKMAGLNILPISRGLSTDGVTRGVYVAARAVLSADTTPTAGAWVAGDVIFHTNPTGANTGTRCTAGGSPGTWGLF